MLKTGICIFFPKYNRATVLIEFMNKLLIVVSIKNLYTPYRFTPEAIIKKEKFYLEYLVGFIQVNILTHKTVFSIGVCCWVNSNVRTNLHKAKQMNKCNLLRKDTRKTRQYNEKRIYNLTYVDCLDLMP